MDTTTIGGEGQVEASMNDIETLKRHVEEARHNVAVARMSLRKAEEALEELISLYSNTMVRQYGDSGLGEQYEH